ncbi:nucleolar protein,Nop52-domain-containing protein [Aspergillus taichungensis]|uniref:Nucleolar protein,Nop52-domain-containing protein n=1 Tax=Aspergillus taichungensis TaxID=482145 RepID=A0A2J5I1Y5_9EURO|nr:nucleolar protein,Nop52-domain-containing protein [Aspergillus taichungensis]
MSDMQKTPFVRELASSDKRTRDKATQSLTLFLRSKTDLSLLELLKLWKGLFFCFYHSDRPLTQQSLARALSYDLVPTLPRSTLLPFLRAFWITIGRDFHSLDRLRLDKYLFLIRCFVGVSFEVLLKNPSSSSSSSPSTNESDKKRKRADDTSSSNNKKRGNGKKGKPSSSPASNNKTEEKEDTTPTSQKDWSTLESYISIISEGPLCPRNFDPDQPPADEANDYVPMPHGPDGLRYHILDLWVDELEKVLEFEGEDETTRKPREGGPPAELLLRPLETLVRESPYKPVRVRAAEALADERLVQWGWKEAKVEEDSDDGSEWGGFD